MQKLEVLVLAVTFVTNEGISAVVAVGALLMLLPNPMECDRIAVELIASVNEVFRRSEKS